MMKLTNILLWVCVLVALVVLVGSHASAETYPAAFVVVSVDYDADEVVLLDFTGDEWIITDCSDWCVGDLVAAIMDDNNTPIIYDDLIVSYLYSGWIEL